MLSSRSVLAEMAWSTRTASPVTSGPGNKKVELTVRLMRDFYQDGHELTDTITRENDDLEADRKVQVGQRRPSARNVQVGHRGSSRISVPLGRHFVFLMQRDVLLLSCFGFGVRVRELSDNTGCKVRKNCTLLNIKQAAVVDLATAAASLRSTETRNPGKSGRSRSPT
jgi:hypothetical protein